MAKPKSSIDPLDAATITSPEAGVGAPAAPSEAETASHKPVSPKPDEAPPEVTPAPPVKTFRVKNTVTISWGSQMVTLRPGHTVSAASHGDDFYERMTHQGVALEEVH